MGKTKKDIEAVDGYEMPENYENDEGGVDLKKKYKPIYERYEDNKPEPKEEDIWAEQQLKIARPQFVKKDNKVTLDLLKDKKNELNNNEFLKVEKEELCLGDQIDFVKHEIMVDLRMKNMISQSKKIKKDKKSSKKNKKHKKSSKKHKKSSSRNNKKKDRKYSTS